MGHLQTTRQTTSSSLLPRVIPNGQFSRFQYTPARAANQKRRLYEQSDAFRDVYRWRAGIEATMSRLKYQMNLAHLRIRGMPAMRYVVNLRALGLNIRRCAAIAP